MDEIQQPEQQPKSSNSKIIIIVIIILLILLGWYFYGKKANLLKSASEKGNTIALENSEAQGMSLKDLMAGKSQKCSVSYDNNGFATKGTIMVANGKMRGDFEIMQNGKPETNHMINDGQMQYMWTEGAHPVAFKMSVTGFENKNENANPPGQTRSIDPAAKYNYNCSPWSGNDSDFLPPSTVEFTDYSAMMAQPPMMQSTQNSQPPAGAGGGQNVKAMQCAACNNLSGDQQTQCKAALSCP